MEPMLLWLKGKKTYILALASMLMYGAVQIEWMDMELANKVMVALGGSIVMSMRAGMKNR